MSADPPRLSRPAAHAMLHVTVLLWGFTAILGREISIAAVPLVWYRLAVSVLGLVVLAPMLGVSLRTSRAAAARYGVVGIIIGAHWLCFYGAVKYAGISTSVLTLSTMAFFTALIEPIVFKRRVATDEIAIGAIVVIGVALLVKVELDVDAIGLLLGLGSALFGALFGTLNGRLAFHDPPMRLFFYEMCAAFAVVSGAFLFVPGKFVAPWALAGGDVFWLVVLGLACTILPQIMSLIVLRTLSPFTVAVTVNLEPVYSLVLAAILYPGEEPITARFCAGAAVLLGLVFFNAWRKARLARATERLAA